MIISRMEGGLGNIMFEYSLGRYLSLKNGTELKYDDSHCKINPLGDYSLALEAFGINIKDHLASSADLGRFKKYAERPGRRWLLYNFLIANNQKYVKETPFRFDPKVLTLKGDFYLHGFWQNEKYFKDIRETLLKDFTIPSHPSLENKRTAEAIARSEAVGIHVRQLDYVTNLKTRAYHGELGRDYYERAISYIAERVLNPTLFIFSDDPARAMQHFRFPYPTRYVLGNNDAPHEDIRLMSLCKHFIVANSSFSWWGAWLIQNKGKIIIAPARWTNDPSDHGDIVPASWIKIENSKRELSP